jgi:hypothetical protein
MATQKIFNQLFVLLILNEIQVSSERCKNINSSQKATVVTDLLWKLFQYKLEITTISETLFVKFGFNTRTKLQ